MGKTDTERNFEKIASIFFWSVLAFTGITLLAGSWWWIGTGFGAGLLLAYGLLTQWLRLRWLKDRVAILEAEYQQQSEELKQFRQALEARELRRDILREQRRHATPTQAPQKEQKAPFAPAVAEPAPPVPPVELPAATPDDAFEAMPPIARQPVPTVAACEGPQDPAVSSSRQRGETKPPLAYESAVAATGRSTEDPAVAPAIERETSEPIHATPPTAVKPPFELPAFVTHFKAWLLGGNTVLRIGSVVLFIGLAFLLRYVTRNWIYQTELNYAGVALTAIVLTALGWRQRKKRPDFGLLVQGLGIAVLYLTIFSALHFHQIVPAWLAFVLLVVITFTLCTLAVSQNALSLALAAVLGAFAAPVLTSTGGGNYIALFSYFALLNAGIAVIAWFKAWRLLNLVGLICTFSIGLSWGLKYYTPDKFSTTEPFAVLFLVMYVVIALLFTRRQLIDAGDPPEMGGRDEKLRWARQQTDYLDATVTLAPPILGFGIQYALVRHIEYGAAFSALALGLFYMGLAWFIAHRGHFYRVLLMMETFLALGVIFGTLAIPLALDAQWTAASWALEGAGLYWLGLRQQRRLARIFALGVQVCALFSFLLDMAQTEAGALINGSAFAALLVGAGWLFSYFQKRADSRPDWEKSLLPVMATTGLIALYLVPPMLMFETGTIIALSAAAALTFFAGRRITASVFLVNALLALLCASLLFLTTLGIPETTMLSGNTWAALALGAAWLAVRLISIGLPDDWEYTKQLAFLHSGFFFIAFSVLLLIAAFHLDLEYTLLVWVASGIAFLLMGERLKMRELRAYALFAQAVSGLVFILYWLFEVFRCPAMPDQLECYSWQGSHTLLAPPFLIPALLALVAFFCAWRYHRRQATAASRIEAAASDICLFWGAGWWFFTACLEVIRFVPAGEKGAALMLVLAVSTLLWSALATADGWRRLGQICMTLMPAALVTLLYQWDTSVRHDIFWHPLQGWGWVAWPTVLAAHLLSMRLLQPLLGRQLAFGHAPGVWFVLLCTALELRYRLWTASATGYGWYWLGWTLLPSLYLVWLSRDRKFFWPIREYLAAYKQYAGLPVAVVLFAWFWAANLMSPGSSAPLPYLPLLNPLEIALLLSLAGVMLWTRHTLPTFGVAQPVCHRILNWGAAASLFAFMTLFVCRLSFHFFNPDGAAYTFKNMVSSMAVQAGWSITWTLCAFGLMFYGTRAKRRQLWIIGAALIGLVVIKLFLVDLSNRGGLERVFSFIGVGTLLLIIGYFSPLPPSQNKETPQ